MKHRIEILVLCGLVLLLTRTQIVHAASIVVNSTAYETLPTINGNCTLLEALYAAEHDTAMDGCAAGSGSDVITVPAGTYLLGPSDPFNATNGVALPINSGTVTLVGAGADQTILQANPQGFNMLAIFVVGTSANVTVDGMTLKNGYTSSNYGAAIHNSGTLVVQNTWLIHNTSNEGGAIANEGTATINNSVLSDNTASSGPGGAIRNGLISNNLARSLTISNTAIYSNTSSSRGGGLNSSGGNVSLSNVSVYQNQARLGGGIYNDGVLALDQTQVYGNSAVLANDSVGGGIINDGVMTMTRSTVSGNTATNEGGIYNVGNGPSAPGNMTINTSAISGNNAKDNGGFANGPFANATLVNVTISGNTATAGVGGILTSSALTLTNVTVANNAFTTVSSLKQTGGTTHVGNTIFSNASGGTNCSGTITSDGHNLDSGNSCSFSGSGDLTNTNAQLGALADNGGGTLTHALLAGSPAIDVGDDSICPVTDQRAKPRPQDGNGDGTAHCDIGAFEADPIPTPTVTSTPTTTPTITPTPTLTPTATPAKAILAGNVKINQVTGTYNVDMGTTPIDVVHVLDISGSMTDNFGTMTKLNASKAAVKNFNNALQPANGDQVGLVTFPDISTGTIYSYNCEQTGQTSTYYFAQTRSALTSNVTTVNTIVNSFAANGGDPFANGLQNGRLVVLNAGTHNTAHPAVLIVTADDLPEMRLTGRWTGVSGNTYDSPPCNANALQDAIDQAQIAKADGNGDGKADVIIYSIAIGTDFNPNLMQAIASPDTDLTKPHYYQVTDAVSLQAVYDQITAQVQTTSCEVTQHEALGGNAVVTIRNTTDSTTMQTTTDASGNFSFNVDPATWEFVSATVTVNGVTYNLFTNGIGGPVLVANPSTVVSAGGTTYTQNLTLNTNQFACTVAATSTPTRTSTLAPTGNETPPLPDIHTQTPTATRTRFLTPTSTPTPTSTDSPTVTATPTITTAPTGTATETPTETVVACAGAPGRAELVAPPNKATVNKPKVVLEWNSVPCASTYQVLVRQGSKKGATLLSNSVNGTSLKVKKLMHGQVYFWRVQACAEAACSGWTGWRRFEIKQ